MIAVGDTVTLKISPAYRPQVGMLVTAIHSEAATLCWHDRNYEMRYAVIETQFLEKING